VQNERFYFKDGNITWFRNFRNASSQYIYYWLLSPFGRQQIDSKSIGSTQKALTIDALLGFDIDLPSLETQYAITDTLSVLDAKISNNTKINHHLEQMVQAIFKSWFVDFEPFANGGFVDSELGAIPDGWRVGVLSDLITVKYGKDHKKLKSGEIPVFGSGGIMRFVDTALYSDESVLIPRKGTLNNVIYVNQPFWAVDTMFYTEMNRPNLAKFVYFFMRSKDLASMNAGSAVPSMTTVILNALPIVIPPDSELIHYEDIVSAQFRKMQACHVENDNLTTIRDSLLPRLMSGELSITNFNVK
jgi:type I restriction enzyme S subunit